ncbi:hypothetical protein EDB83DRAFT_2351308 [Lactarius deliciosus]|nr:hypothetical protein EDB83DRAFT_2422137 [Lactarius deliciosus]KAH9075614.1 hypothetical protein EDB83DRAFT_2351308 [Lactarius deliciosus]
MSGHCWSLQLYYHSLFTYCNAWKTQNSGPQTSQVAGCRGPMWLFCPGRVLCRFICPVYLSTFVNEMTSSAMIPGLASSESLVLIDELGRATSSHVL